MNHLPSVLHHLQVGSGNRKLSIKDPLPQRVSGVFPGLLAILLLVSMKTNSSFHKHKLPSGPETLVGGLYLPSMGFANCQENLSKVKMGSFGAAPPSFCSDPDRSKARLTIVCSLP